MASERDDVLAVLRRINQTWLGGQVEELEPMLDPEIVMAFPGFAGSIRGKDAFLEGFRDFQQNAKTHEFGEQDHQVDVVGDTGVVTFRYEMVYERGGARYRATGRDLWVFHRQSESWIAVWRAMLEMEESAV